MQFLLLPSSPKQETVSLAVRFMEKKKWCIVIFIFISCSSVDAETSDNSCGFTLMKSHNFSANVWFSLYDFHILAWNIQDYVVILMKEKKITEPNSKTSILLKYLLHFFLIVYLNVVNSYKGAQQHSEGWMSQHLYVGANKY